MMTAHRAKAYITIRYKVGSLLPDQTVKCDCGHPIFEIRNGNIYHFGRHNGEVHENTVRFLPIDKEAQIGLN